MEKLDQNKLEALLKYQSLDLKLKKINDDIQNSDEYKKMEQAKSAFNTAKQIRQDNETQAESLLDFIGKSEKYCEENSEKLVELESKLSSTDPDSEDRKELFRQIDTLNEKFNELERKISERRIKSEKIIKDFIDAQEKGKKYKEIYAKYKKEVESKKAEMSAAAAALSRELKDIEAKCDKDLMLQYHTLAGENKYPVFVRLNMRSCSGCGIELSGNKLASIDRELISRCDNCRRIIYK